MAEALEPVSAEPEVAAPAATVVPTLLRVEKAHPGRFRLAIFALGIVLGTAIAGFVLLATHPDQPAAPFAQGIAPGTTAGAIRGDGGWHPVCDVEFGCDRPHQIAAYVAPKYELPTGKDIVSITAGPPTIPSADGSPAEVPVIIERNDRGARVVYTTAAQDNTVQYSLCGFDKGCTIGGKPSVERGDLLRRQALELALLTFRYDTTVKSVLTFFPKPVKAADPAYVLFFRRADYTVQLARPLAATLGKQVVLKPGAMTDAQASSIGDVTSPRVFKYDYRQNQQGFPILLLTPAAY